MIEFDYKRIWWAQNDLYGFVMLWDSYGFFTHVSTKMFMEEVMNVLPEGYTVKELDDMMNKFFRKYKHLYCCMN